MLTPKILNPKPQTLSFLSPNLKPVYAVKYIECHALGVSFDPKDFARCNAKKMRDNMAVDIWKELVDQHLKENVDGDKFVGMYD